VLIGDPEVLLGEQLAKFEELLKQFFTIDGLSAKQLLSWPMDALREPAAWRRYDHLSVRGRLDMMTDLPREYKDLIEMHCTSVSSLPADETAFMVPLRWYALGGYTFAGSTAISSMYRIANGGMTSLAKAMLSEVDYDRVFDREVTAINQDDKGVTIKTRNGSKVTADLAICTIPL
jgi:lysyl oxidase-like protein 2/3/4